MIDITSIQTFPAAPILSALQGTNSTLAQTNKQLKRTIEVFAIACCAYVFYRIIKKHSEHNQNAEEKF